MTIAFDVGPVRAQPTGVGVYASAMARALSKVVPEDRLRLIGRRRDAMALPDNVISRSRSGRPYPLWVQLESGSDARRVGADIVHYSDGIVPLVRHGRTVLTVHDLSAIRQWRTHRAPRWLRIPLVLLSPRLAELVIVPSRATADEIVSICRIPAGRIEIVPYAPADGLRPADAEVLAAVLARYDLEPRTYIVALGTIEPRKNHLRLIHAFERLLADRAVAPNLELIVIGKAGWGSDRVLDAISRSPARHRIRVLGYVHGEDVPAILTGAGAVAYVSVYEGFGLPVVEALACGAPTVTSNISSMPEVAGEAAFLVDPLDVDDIARGLSEALHGMNSAHEAIKAAALAQASRFTWQAAAERVADLYERL